MNPNSLCQIEVFFFYCINFLLTARLSDWRFWNQNKLAVDKKIQVYYIVFLYISEIYHPLQTSKSILDLILDSGSNSYSNQFTSTIFYD